LEAGCAACAFDHFGAGDLVVWDDPVALLEPPLAYTALTQPMLWSFASV
jgi:hypothetical protein